MGDTTKRNMCFIAGPPFSGKSTIGAILARRLCIPFEDIDEVIERSAGVTIGDIFLSEGEDGFRRIESRCLVDIAGTPGPLVVALGGGTLLSPENLRTVVSRGVLVTLAPDTDELLARFELSGGRPLVPDQESLAVLLKARGEHYAGLPGRIDTTGKTPEEVVAVIVESSGLPLTPR